MPSLFGYFEHSCIFVWMYVLISFWYIPWSHLVTQCSTFGELPDCLLKRLHYFMCLLAMYENSGYSISSRTLLSIAFKKMFILEWERERESEHVSRGGVEREGDRDRESEQCRARCGAGTHDLWDHDPRQSWMLNGLSHPSAPPLWL